MEDCEIKLLLENLRLKELNREYLIYFFLLLEKSIMDLHT